MPAPTDDSSRQQSKIELMMWSDAVYDASLGAPEAILRCKSWLIIILNYSGEMYPVPAQGA